MAPKLCFIDCGECGSSFRPPKRSSRFCSKPCASRNRARARTGATNANWRGVADVGERPARHVIDRIDNDGPYAPGNVRWATYSTSNRNRRPTHLGRTRSRKGTFV